MYQCKRCPFRHEHLPTMIRHWRQTHSAVDGVELAVVVNPGNNGDNPVRRIVAADRAPHSEDGWDTT